MIRQHALNSHDSGTFTSSSNNDMVSAESADGDISVAALNRQVCFVTILLFFVLYSMYSSLAQFAVYFLILSYIASHSLSSSFSQTSESSELSSLYTEVLMDDGGIDRKVSEYMQTLLRERFTNKMLEIVDELQLAYSHHDLVRGAGSVFPVRAGEFHFWFVCRDTALLPLIITLHTDPLLMTCCLHCI